MYNSTCQMVLFLSFIKRSSLEYGCINSGVANTRINRNQPFSLIKSNSQIRTHRVFAEHSMSSSTSCGHFIFCDSSSTLSIVSSTAGGARDGNGERSSDEDFSFFFSSPLAFDSMAGMAGGSSVCIGLTGSDKPLFLT